MLLRVLRRDVEPPRRHTRWPARSLPEVIRRARGQGYGGQPSGTRPTDKSFHRSIEPGTSPCVENQQRQIGRTTDLRWFPSWTGQVQHPSPGGGTMETKESQRWTAKRKV